MLKGGLIEAIIHRRDEGTVRNRASRSHLELLFKAVYHDSQALSDRTFICHGQFKEGAVDLFGESIQVRLREAPLAPTCL